MKDVSCVAAAEEPWCPAFVRAVYSANFAEDRAIGEASMIGEILTRLGQDASIWLSRAGAASVIDRIADIPEITRSGLALNQMEAFRIGLAHLHIIGANHRFEH